MFSDSPLSDRPGNRRRCSRPSTALLFLGTLAWFLVAGRPALGPALGAAPAGSTGGQGADSLPVPATDVAESSATADFPLRHVQVEARISGCIAQVQVEQTFHNPCDRSIEAVYVFPLPHGAAVNDMEIRIGDRVVRAEIRTREQARGIYDTAKREGRIAALLDQERPNIFTQQVAHIQPGHDVLVRLRYVEDLEFENGAYEMVFPTVVGPRFIPGRPQAAVRVEPAARHGSADADRFAPPIRRGPSGTGWSPDTDRVPDASRITPPVVRPGLRAGHDVQISVDLDAGVPLQVVECPSHAVDVERPGRSRARLRLRPSDTIPNKDFVMRYCVTGDAPEFGLLAHRDTDGAGGAGYFLLHVVPQATVTDQEARPKEVIFLLDTSGSMSGEPLARSKAAMRWALQHLGPDDTFQIIRFSDDTSTFAPAPVRGLPAEIERALRYVEQLAGAGGTQMLSGIRAALDVPADPLRLRIVCMLTDGYIGNETEILAEVRQRLGRARLFSFGVGNSVNRYLLDALAEEGRGAVDYVPLDGETRPLVERFYDRIARPHLTDLEIDWGNLDVQGIQPAALPDLFAGQTMALCGRYLRGGTDEIVVRGRLGRRRFERRLHVVLPARAPEHAVLGTLWARRRIETLMSRMVRGEQEPLVQEVTRTAVAFRLVSRYTSFVAADNQVTSATGDPMLVPQPVEMPLGVSYEGVFGALPVESVTQATALNTGVAVQGGHLHVRSGRATGSMLETVRVTSKAKQVDAKSSDVSHTASDASRLNAVLNLPPGGDDVSEGGALDLAGASLAASMAVEPARVSLGERACIRITVRNTGRDAVMVPEVLLWTDLVLQVRRDGGEPIQTSFFSPRRGRTVALPPGGSRTYVLVLGEAPESAQLGVPGRCAIQLVQLCGQAVQGNPARCEIHID